MNRTLLIAIIAVAAILLVFRAWSRARPRRYRRSSRASGISADSALLPGVPGVRTFRLGMHGESLKNPDGSSRQHIIRGCRPGQPVLLLPEPDNPHDHLAVKVCRRSGEPIGYLPAGHGLTKRIKAGRVSAVIDSIFGGTEGKPSSGVVLAITVEDQ